MRKWDSLQFSYSRPMDEFRPERPVEILSRLNLSEEAVRDHNLSPAHISDAISNVDRSFPVVDTPPSGLLYHLDVEGFGTALHNLLSSCVVGYSMQLRRNGRTVLNRQFGKARTPAGGNVDWTAGVPMHIASSSKLITSIALTRVLRDRNLSPDTFIVDWLPAYWQKGHHANRITFRHLLTHTSGLNFGGSITPSDFAFMKTQIARGTTNLGQEAYRNVNYGLLRILISTLSGQVPAGATFSMFGLDLNDNFWDVTTINAYRSYVMDNVFAPAGVSAPTLDHPDDNALAYPFPVVEPGWDSGDLSTMSGGIAWHISTGDLLDVMGALRRGGAILTPAQAEAMLESKFGLDVKQNTSLGRLYAKGGFWGNPAGTCFEQSNAYFLPKGMELVILANSPFCAAGQAFMPAVTKAIEDNIKPNRVALTAGAASVLGAILGAGARIRARRRLP